MKKRLRWIAAANGSKVLNMDHLAIIGINPNNPLEVIAISAINGTTSVLYRAPNHPEEAVLYMSTLVREF